MSAFLASHLSPGLKPFNCNIQCCITWASSLSITAPWCLLPPLVEAQKMDHTTALHQPDRETAVSGTAWAPASRPPWAVPGCHAIVFLLQYQASHGHVNHHPLAPWPMRIQMPNQVKRKAWKNLQNPHLLTSIGVGKASSHWILANSALPFLRLPAAMQAFSCTHALVGQTLLCSAIPRAWIVDCQCLRQLLPKCVPKESTWHIHTAQRYLSSVSTGQWLSSCGHLGWHHGWPSLTAGTSLSPALLGCARFDMAQKIATRMRTQQRS